MILASQAILAIIWKQGFTKREHATPLIHNLGWMRLTNSHLTIKRVSLQMLTWPCTSFSFGKFYPEQECTPIYQTRQSNDLHVPMTTARSDQRTFRFNGVKDNNALPSHVKKASSYGKFKLRLKTELGY